MRRGRLCAVALGGCLLSVLPATLAAGDGFGSLLEKTLGIVRPQQETAVPVDDQQALYYPEPDGTQGAAAAGNEGFALAAWTAVADEIPAPPPEVIPAYAGPPSHAVVPDAGYPSVYDDGMACGEGCSNELLCDVWDSCANFCQAGLTAGVEATFLATCDEPDQTVRLTDGIKDRIHEATSCTGLGSGLRTWVGLQRCGWGIRFQYWYLHDEEIKADPTIPIIAEPTLEKAFALNADVFDVELTQRLNLGCWQVDTSLGGRHARLKRNSTVLGYGTIGRGVNVYGLAVGANEMEGNGFTFSLGARKPIFGCCGWYGFLGYRGSILWADSEAGTLTEANAVITSPVVGAANSRDRALACDDGSDEVCISEFQVGIQYERCLACLAANLFCRVALEYQYWDTGDLYAASSSYAFLEGGFPEFAGRVDASADAHDGDLDLIGLALRVGLDY